MKQPLQVLIVEDSENDALLLEFALQGAGYAPVCRRVETAEGLSAELQRQPWDLVIADYRMPHFDGLAALAMVKQQGLDLPFIIVSGQITEETAVAAMKAGAHDYVMKDNLARLGSAVERELREAEVRREQRRSADRLKLEHTFREAIENSVLAGISTVDLDGRQTYVNPAFCAMVGWSEAELLGQQQPFAYWPPEEAASISQALNQVMQGGGPAPALELRFCRRNGKRFDVLLQITPLKDTSGQVAGWVSSASDITELKEAEAHLAAELIQRQRAEEALQRAHDGLELRVRERTADLEAANAKLQTAIVERKRLEQELLEITEKERRRIGLDLHDDLGQKLSGIALMTKGLELRLAKKEATAVAAQEAARIYTFVTQAMNHASDVAHDLATLDSKENDLPTALTNLAEEARNMFAIGCRFKSQGTVPPLEPTAVSQLYKIAQEAVTNAIKHGKAKQVEIQLARDSNRLLLTIKNNGQPFPDLDSNNTGMGLRIMNYRANLVGASLLVKGTGARGTLVTCTVPLR